MADSWRTGKTTAERGYGGRWQTVRRHFLRANPLCVMCAQQGRVEAASVVDHIRPHEGDPSKFWDAENMQALCKRCHDSHKQRQERGTYRPAIGVDGWPIP